MAGEEPDALGEASFAGLVVMLGTSGFAQLGAAPPPEGGQPRVDLEAAKQVIDLLDMLRTKTKGNLTPAEAELLEGILFDLRMRFVEAKRSGGAAAPVSSEV